MLRNLYKRKLKTNKSSDHKVLRFIKIGLMFVCRKNTTGHIRTTQIEMTKIQETYKQHNNNNKNIIFKL